MIKDNPMRVGDEDYSPEPVKVKSLFDFENDIDWRVDNPAQSKPDQFEIELARQERERKELALEKMIKIVKGRGY